MAPTPQTAQQLLNAQALYALTTRRLLTGLNGGEEITPHILA